MFKSLLGSDTGGCFSLSPSQASPGGREATLVFPVCHLICWLLVFPAKLNFGDNGLSWEKRWG